MDDLERSLEIKQRYEKNEPLNLSRVEIECPWLLEGLYNPECFKSWKEAIEEAGLSYNRIRIEPTTEATCLICGYTSASIASHLNTFHKLSSAEYRKQFPHGETFSEASRSANFGKCKGSSRPAQLLMPHWEPAWSSHYVLDRIKEFQKQDISLNYAYLAKHEPGLPAFARRIWGSWDYTLGLLGIDPEDIRMADIKKEYTKESAIHALKELYAENPKQIHIERGNLTALRTLLSSIFTHFDSYKTALEEADLCPSDFIPALKNKKKLASRDKLISEAELRLKTKSTYDLAETKSFLDRHHQTIIDFYALWLNFTRSINTTERILFKSPNYEQYSTEEEIIEAVQQRHEAGLGMKEAEVSVDNPSLKIVGVKHFTRWSKVLKAAGVKPIPHSYNIRDYKEPEDVLNEIRRRHAAGQPLYRVDLEKTDSEFEGRSLLKWAKIFFGSYKQAFEKAGVKYPGHKVTPKPLRTKYQDPDTVIKGLKQRAASGLSMLSSEMRMKPKFGGEPALLDAAKREFGSLKQAIISAGITIPPKPKSPKRRSPRKWTRDLVISEIQARKKAGLSLYTTHLMRNKVNGGDAVLHSRALQLFGTWKAALEAAGFDEENR